MINLIGILSYYIILFIIGALISARPKQGSSIKAVRILHILLSTGFIIFLLCMASEKITSNISHMFMDIYLSICGNYLSIDDINIVEKVFMNNPLINFAIAALYLYSGYRIILLITSKIVEKLFEGRKESSAILWDILIKPLKYTAYSIYVFLCLYTPAIFIGYTILTDRRASIITNSITFPTLIMILTAEIYTFLTITGRTEEEKTVKQTDKNAFEKESFLSECVKVFKPKVLAYSAETEISDKRLLDPKKIKNEEDRVLFENIMKKGYNLNDDYYYEQMWDGESVILNGAVFERYAPVLISYMNKVISRNGMVIMIIEDSIYNDSEKVKDICLKIENWFENVFGTKTAKVTTIRNYHPNIPDVLVTSTRELYKTIKIISSIKSKNIANICFVNLFEGETSLSENLIEYGVISRLFNEAFRKIQYITFSSGSLNLGAVLDINLGTKMIEKKIEEKNGDTSFIIWKEEDGMRFQDYIFDGYHNGYAGAEGPLSVIGQKHSASDILIMNHSGEGNKDNLEEFDKALKNIKLQENYAVSSAKKPQICNAKGDLIYSPVNNGIIVIKDRENNIIKALNRGNGLSDGNSVISVTSSPYMLRNYFIRNFKYFSTAPLSPLSPKITKNKLNTAFYLIDLMTGTIEGEEKQADEKTVSNALEIIGMRGSTEENLRKLFIEVFDIDILRDSYLRVKKDTEYDNKNKRYIDYKYFTLSPDIKHNSAFDSSKEYSIIDSGNTILGYIRKDRIYPEYLIGTIKAINEYNYVVINIDMKNEIINVEKTVNERPKIYRCKDTIDIKSIELPYYSEEKKYGTYTLEKKIHLSDYTIKTVGYYTFMKGIELGKDSGVSYQDLNNDKSKYERRRKNGRLLSVRINSADTVNSFNEKACTLAVAFKEILTTLFPGMDKYVKVFTKLPEGFFEFGNFLNHVLPENINISRNVLESSSKSIRNNDEKSICLYFIEDSDTDLGIIHSLCENFEYVMNIVQDYMKNEEEINSGKVNYIADSSTEKEFLNYGFDEPEEQEKLQRYINIEETSEYLDTLIKNNEIRNARMRKT